MPGPAQATIIAVGRTFAISNRFKMTYLNRSIRALSLLLISLLASLSIQAQPSINLLEVVGGFSGPVEITTTGVAGDQRLFVVEQEGRIRITTPSGITNPSPFLDISEPVNSFANEQGLLGLAFHPDYVTNGHFFVNYTRSDDATVISRFTVDAADPDLADASSEVVFMTIPQPYTNHNGGCLRFGPDGYLYIGTGDGGFFGDPGNRSQSPTQLLGKMLRIDVDGPTYSIPADNPWAGSADTLPEIWQFGLRNPWKYTFDRETGDLWIADVGQNAWEEIDFQPASSAGGENWGWRCYEGDVIFNASGCGGVSEYDFPAFVYDHFSGGLSVTGGFVYRGELNHQLVGHYVFADYVTGRWWSMKWNECSNDWDVFPQGVVQSDISTFGEDADGELYVGDLQTGGIYRVLEECSVNPVPLVDVDGTSFDGVLLDLFTDSVTGATYNWYEASDDDFCSAVDRGINSHLLEDAIEGQWYWVEVTYSDGCVILSDGYPAPLFEGLANLEQVAVEVAPNPVKDVLQIDVAEFAGQAVGVLLVDIAGRAVISELHIGPNFQLNVSELPEAVYFLAISSDDKVAIQKVVVQR